MKKLITILAVCFSIATATAQDEAARLGALAYPEMVLVEGGTFTMGDTEMEGYKDEQPAHEVTLKTFSIAKTETTVLQWRTFCNATGRSFPKEMEGKVDAAPMAYVSWHDAVAYTDWLADKTGKNYRLPTEAEWEYAARGGNKSQGHKYSGGRSLDNVGWFTDNAKDGTKKVAFKRANELGIYDMSGNVWEWCRDWYSESYYAISPKDNPKGPPTGEGRILRGGFWFNSDLFCRVAYRSNSAPSVRYYEDFGFRVVLSQ